MCEDLTDFEPKVLDLQGMTVSEEMTTPSRIGKKPRAVWVVRGRTAVHELLLKSLGGRKYNGAWSFWEDPAEQLAEALAEGVAPTFAQSVAEQQEALQQRRLARAESREEWAASAQRESDAAYQRVRQIGDMIPFGQPILVGHHSEGRHRRDIARMDSDMRKSVESADRAKDHEAAAQRLRQLAAAQQNPVYLDNRVRETKAQIATLERRLEGKIYVYSDPSEISDNARRHYETLLGLEREKLAYWQEMLLAAGGGLYSKENVAAGDAVKVRGYWAKVVRANPTTVSVETQYSWTMKYSYAEIREHKTKAQIAAEAATANPSAEAGENE